MNCSPIRSDTRDTAARCVAFGAQAERFAQLLPQGFHGILCDGTQPAEALAHATQLRRAGISFLVGVFIDHAAGAITRSLAPIIFENFQHIDDRRQRFESIINETLYIDQVPFNKLYAYPQAVMATLRELCRMGNALLVRSQTERNYLESCWNLRRSFYAVAPVKDPTIPSSRPDSAARRIVVWAPHTPARHLTLFAFALWHLKESALFICDGSLPDTPHQFLTYADALAVLPEAAVIIDPDLCDPGTTLAFAGRGYGLVASKTSGAHEYVQGLVTYDPTDVFDIFGAVGRARGQRQNFCEIPLIRADYFQAVLDASKPQLPETLPLVSIAVPTYNRRNELQRNLEGFALQEYPNIEVLVVNDCGIDVSDIVEKFPFARYLKTPTNGGSVRAVNYALSQARGEYYALVADDDLDYPDHISAVMSAILSSGLKVGYGNILLRLDTMDETQEIKTYGHLLIHDSDLDPQAILWCSNWTHIQGFIAHRSVFEAIGFLNEQYSCADDINGMMEIASRFDIAHADVVIGEMAYRDDHSNQSAKAGLRLVDEFREIMARHCPPNRPMIAQRQAIALQGVFIGQTRGVIFSPHIRLQQMLDIPAPRNTLE